MGKKVIKALIAILLIVFTSFVAFGVFTFNKEKNHDVDAFSVDNVVKDIEFISLEHHSIMHPIERERVRDYLLCQLDEMGGNAEYLSQDSIKCKFGGTYDISDVYCEFNPTGKDESSSYIMLVAHFDSRFPEQAPHKEVVSYGAADDGYGVAVILELLRGALQYRNDWQQGIRVLFTDSEEHELDGMRTAYERYNYIFDNVALMVNVEARGVKGPALMFEMAGDNKKLTDFYLDNARYPFIYSLMGTIYDIMPNFSDFTLGKTIVPGYNLSVIDNISYYHTDKDCFENINTKSLGNYGGQLQPMVKDFLTSSDYSDPDYFRPGEDNKKPILFTVPGLGTIRFPHNFYYFFNALVFLLFCIVLCSYVITRRVELKNVFKQMLKLLLFSIIIFGAGEGIAFIAAKIAGTQFHLVSTKYVSHDNLVIIASIAVMAIVYILLFARSCKKNPNFVFEHLLGGILLLIVFSAVLLALIGDNFFLMGPVACALLALLLHLFVYLNLFSLPALLLIELLAVSFIYIVSTALTIGSLGIVMFFAFFYLVMIVSLYECYMIQKR